MTPYVLVVEDEDALATLLDYNLMKEGFRVERAADGEEALLRVAEEPPDLVVLDWMLPKVSGVEVCRARTSIKCRSSGTWRFPSIGLSPGHPTGSLGSYCQRLARALNCASGCITV